MGGRGIKYVSKRFAYFRLKSTLRVYTPGTLCKACNVNIATKRYHFKKKHQMNFVRMFTLSYGTFVMQPTYIFTRSIDVITTSGKIIVYWNRQLIF